MRLYATLSTDNAAYRSYGITLTFQGDGEVALNLRFGFKRRSYVFR